MELLDCKHIDSVTDYIARMVHPSKVILFNRKRDIEGLTTSFKLCVVAEVADRFEAEKQIYLGADCDVPFDLLFYTPAEWAQYEADPHSFAHKISEGVEGSVWLEGTMVLTRPTAGIITIGLTTPARIWSAPNC